MASLPASHGTSLPPSNSLLLSPTPRLLKTGKLAPTPLPQPLQRQPHLWQLRLQLRARLVIRSLIQLLIDLALDFARALCRVLTQRLRYELHIQRRLHERGKRIPLALLDGFEKLARGLLEQVGEDLGGEGRGSG